MSKRLRLAKYSKKIVCCNQCPMCHDDEIPGILVCKAGIHTVIINRDDAMGIPKGCPLEEFDGSSKDTP